MGNQQDMYNGMPSIILKQRPFFSIIIPCYNSRETLPKLLDSILDQDMEDEIEVILSDDHSTESYQDIVDKYKVALSIRQVQTEYNFAPGNTRERGVSVAEGEWVCFADHDDEFIPDTLHTIKKEILRNNEKYYAIANFLEVNASTGETIREMIGTRNWNHAKFYNLDNLWKAKNIHFKKDLLTHEDIYISSRINCAIYELGTSPLFINTFCYIWNNRPTTISREKYGDRTFIEVFFKDYIASTGRVYLEQLMEGNLEPNYAYDSVIEVLLFCYFYTQGFKYRKPDTYMRENIDHAREYFKDIKRTFDGLTNKNIYDYVSRNDVEMYNNVKTSAVIGVGPFIETETFMQWMNMLHEDIQPRVTMSDTMHK